METYHNDCSQSPWLSWQHNTCPIDLAAALAAPPAAPPDVAPPAVPPAVTPVAAPMPWRSLTPSLDEWDTCDTFTQALIVHNIKDPIGEGPGRH